jgi:signal transduction histidine kinase
VRQRGSLAQRISLLATAAAVITAVLAGALSVGLIRNENGASARRTLARLADAAQATADRGADPAAGQLRASRTLLALKVQSARVNSDGAVSGTNALARAALTPSDVTQLLAGRSVSAQRVVNSQRILIEGRGTRAGGIALVQRRADATAGGDRAIRRMLLALLIAVAIAVVLALLVAHRIARPLRRTAAAAHALAAGRRDVTVLPDGPVEVAAVGHAVNTLAKALSYSEGRQRQFLLSVSHDLRTPLTAITGYAESLADGVVPPEQSAQVGSIILGEAYRLDRLVADLLDLARLDAQEFRIDVVPVDLVELARAAAQVWGGRCAASGVPFLFSGPDGADSPDGLDSPDGSDGSDGSDGARGTDRSAGSGGTTQLWIRTDPSRLRQVLDGLLENALRVTPSGRPIVLAVRAETAGRAGDGGSYGSYGSEGRNEGDGWAVAEVRDGGPGLTEDDLAVAFDRSVLFDRYRGVRQVGTGLGLAIVHGLVSRLGGTVQAGHAAEGGARFTVRLPSH